MGILSRLFSRIPIARALFADIVFRAPEVKGQYSRSSFTWRIKRDSTGRHYLGVRMIPDGGAGEGGGAQFINFDPENAERVREGLDDALEYLRAAEAQSGTRRSPVRG